MKNGNKLKSKFSVYKLVVGLVLALYTISLALIIYWCLTTALKTQADFRTNKALGLPKGAPWDWEWKNFSNLLSNFFVPVKKHGVSNTPVGLLEILFNTVVYAFGGAFVATLIPCIVAYVTAKFDYKMSKIIYTAVIVIMVLPIVGNLPSALSVLQTLGLYDRLIGCLVQKMHFLNMYYLVFFATFKGLAKDYSEAAYIDGASEWRIFLQIMLPLVRTGFMTIMLIFFIEFWNDYQTPLLYMPNHPTLSYSVYYISNNKLMNPETGFNFSTVPIRMVTCIIMVIPSITLFLIFKNRMIGNLSMGGIKG